MDRDDREGFIGASEVSDDVISVGELTDVNEFEGEMGVLFIDSGTSRILSSRSQALSLFV